MATNVIGLDQIDEKMRTPVREYAQRLQAACGDNLLGLTLYGPIVTAEFNVSRQSAQNLLVLQDVDLQLLRTIARDGNQFGRQHIAAPIVMTPQYINDSLDTFPLELIEIQLTHITILGTDHFDGLKFEDAHVRLQCERELKTQLIGMRQGLLAAAGREKLLGSLEVNSARKLLRTMQGLLWLKGQKDVRNEADIVAGTEELIDKQLPGIRVALDGSAEHGWQQYVDLYEDLEALRKKVDAW